MRGQPSPHRLHINVVCATTGSQSVPHAEGSTDAPRPPEAEHIRAGSFAAGRQAHVRVRTAGSSPLCTECGQGRRLCRLWQPSAAGLQASACMSFSCARHGPLLICVSPRPAFSVAQSAFEVPFEGVMTYLMETSCQGALCKGRDALLLIAGP